VLGNPNVRLASTTTGSDSLGILKQELLTNTDYDMLVIAFCKGLHNSETIDYLIGNIPVPTVLMIRPALLIIKEEGRD